MNSRREKIKHANTVIAFTSKRAYANNNEVNSPLNFFFVFFKVFGYSQFIRSESRRYGGKHFIAPSR